MLFKSGRLRNDIPAEQYMNDIILTMSLTVLPVTPEISALSQQDIFIHKDPANRLNMSVTNCQHRRSIRFPEAPLYCQRS
jgi:PIN domain nuclease of toxin-antitoxin system